MAAAFSIPGIRIFLRPGGPGQGRPCDPGGHGVPQREKTTDVAPHLTAGEAGRLASLCGAEQLLCTHIWGGENRDQAVLSEAKAYFPNTLVVEELHEYII